MFTTKSASRALTAVFALGLLACGGGDADTAADSTGTTTPPPAATTALNGETEYQTVCGTCHQADGNGMAGAFPPLTESPFVTAASPNRLIAIVLKGLTGPITIKGVEYNSVMAPWESLTDDQIAAITTYERSSWGHTAAAVTPAMVAEVRASVASRTTSWTVAELEAAVP